MNREEFNKNMDDYLKKRRSPVSSSLRSLGLRNIFPARTINAEFAGKKESYEKDPEQDVVETEEVNEDELEDMEEDMEDIEEKEEDLESDRENILKRFLKKMRIFNRKRNLNYEDIEGENDSETIDSEEEELKKFLKMSYKWLNYMPRSELKAFKEGEDFQTYKSLLKKYGLIK
ncbi:hypothetical protein JW949_01190 [Candidatus Woesearchaeota archaeon]|jgi:hypothetical protein|nr:hypothetical protein [Candidatus Woesearchaeota archaeon]